MKRINPPCKLIRVHPGNGRTGVLVYFVSLNRSASVCEHFACGSTTIGREFSSDCFRARTLMRMLNSLFTHQKKLQARRKPSYSTTTEMLQHTSPLAQPPPLPAYPLFQSIALPIFAQPNCVGLAHLHLFVFSLRGWVLPVDEDGVLMWREFEARIKPAERG